MHTLANKVCPINALSPVYYQTIATCVCVRAYRENSHALHGKRSMAFYLESLRDFEVQDFLRYKKLM